jgi:hypothetical protein
LSMSERLPSAFSSRYMLGQRSSGTISGGILGAPST